ncbi:MAG: hypothetical protein ACTSWP_10765 [Candidatus Freyarchaeota archaeon]
MSLLKGGLRGGFLRQRRFKLSSHAKRMLAVTLIVAVISLVVLAVPREDGVNVAAIGYTIDKLGDVEEKLNYLSALGENVSGLESIVSSFKDMLLNVQNLTIDLQLWTNDWESTWSSWLADTFQPFKSWTEGAISDINSWISSWEATWDDWLTNTFQPLQDLVNTLDATLDVMVNKVRKIHGAVVPVDYPTLQDALSSGEKIVTLLNGTYEENLDFHAATLIRVVGVGNVTIVGAVNVTNVAFSGVAFDGGGSGNATFTVGELVDVDVRGYDKVVFNLGAGGRMERVRVDGGNIMLYGDNAAISNFLAKSAIGGSNNLLRISTSNSYIADCVVDGWIRTIVDGDGNRVEGCYFNYSNGDWVLTVSGDYNTIEGCKIESRSPDGFEFISLLGLLVSGSYNTITGNTITCSGGTISGYLISQLAVGMKCNGSHNTITGNTVDVNCEAKEIFGLHISKNHNTVTGNTVQVHGSCAYYMYGIYVVGETVDGRHVITGNVIDVDETYCGEEIYEIIFGVYLDGTLFVAVSGNWVRAVTDSIAVRGIMLHTAKYTSLDGNTIGTYNPGGAERTGIYLYNTVNTVIDGNIIFAVNGIVQNGDSGTVLGDNKLFS